MFAMLRLAAMVLVLLTIVYVSVWLYRRAVQRDRLEAEWHQNPQGERSRFVEEGLLAQAPRLRRNLILGVYIVPSLLLVALIYFTNA